MIQLSRRSYRHHVQAHSSKSLTKSVHGPMKTISSSTAVNVRSSCFKRSPPSYAPVISDGLEFEQVSNAKILGVTIRQDLKWNDHIDNITAKAAKRIFVKRAKRSGVSCNELVLFYCGAIRSVLEYASMLFHQSLP